MVAWGHHVGHAPGDGLDLVHEVVPLRHVAPAQTTHGISDTCEFGAKG